MATEALSLILSHRARERKTLFQFPTFCYTPHCQLTTGYCLLQGEVPERLLGALSKSVVAVRSPWVRIPPSPLNETPACAGVFACDWVLGHVCRLCPATRPTPDPVQITYPASRCAGCGAFARPKMSASLRAIRRYVNPPLSPYTECVSRLIAFAPHCRRATLSYPSG